MNEKDIKDLIPIYIEGALNDTEKKLVEEYLAAHPEMKSELDAFKQTWEMLGDVKDIEPSPNYVSRFWTELSLRKSWHERVYESIKTMVLQKRLVPVFATACVLIIVGVILFKNYTQLRGPLVEETTVDIVSLDTKEKGNAEEAINMDLFEQFETLEDAALTQDIEIADDLEFLEELEFLEDLELLEELELLEDLEYLEKIETYAT